MWQCIAKLTNPAHGRELVEDAVRTFGRLDCLVGNHGIWPPHDAPIESMADTQWHRTMHVNLDSMFGVVQAAVAQFKKQGRPAKNAASGWIVLISSTAAQRGEAMHADYAASKGGDHQLHEKPVERADRGWDSRQLRGAGLGGYGTCPRPRFRDPQKRGEGSVGDPAGRAAIPAEIAGPVLFLCTPLAGFVSGEVFNVNGGSVLIG